MINYPKKILPTLSLFFKYKNEFDLYIEDSNDEEFYKALVKRLLLPNVKIDKLIPLGCKTKVIEACEADQLPRKRKRLYLIDGDLDLIYNNNRSDLKHLFVLDRYCIENFVLDEEGLVEILHDCVVLEKTKIKKILTYTNWLKGISNPLIELFLHYSICHQLSTGTRTVSNPIGSLCKQDKTITILDQDKINQLISNLRNEIISNIGVERYDEIIYDRRERWPSNIKTLLTIVSAKDYLLPLLEFRFKKIKGKESYNLKRETFRLRLAKCCSLDSLEDLKEELNRA